MTESFSRQGGEDPQLLRIVEEFIHERDEGRLGSLEEFCARYPESQREEVRKKCEQVLRLEGELGERRTETCVEPQTLTAGQLVCEGRFRILRVLGEGGMGTVYLAQQNEPVRRRVALKVIKPGMDSKQVLRRFEAERQALAMMEHSNIAQVFDAGTTEAGQPYFVMEYIKGIPLTEHCDEHKATIEERIELFRDVCSGVQHAHQKGIMHRDLKPSNVLVSYQEGKAIPKIIDFGLARATNHELVLASVVTEQGLLVGTPEYMSPEQAGLGGQDIDTRTDVYSLGILLYELLVGELPFSPEELRRAGLGEMQRKIREDDPPKPSTRLSTQEDTGHAARRRRTDARSLLRRLRGDLDWIVMKALEKDRARRYETPAAFSDDLQRHLEHEPVLAGPPSAGYRLRKLVRRYRGRVVAAAIVLLALIGGTIGTSIGLLEARQARDEATARADELEQVAEFQARQLRDIDPEMMGIYLRSELIAEARAAMERDGLDEAVIQGRSSAVEELLAGTNFTNLALGSLESNIFERALGAIDEQFADQPLVMARLQHAVASSMWNLGLVDGAVDPLDRALAIRRRELGEDDTDTLLSVHDMGLLLRSGGDLDEAEQYLREALGGYRRVLGDDHRETMRSMSNLGDLLQEQGKFAEAERYSREALQGRRRVLGDDHVETLMTVNSLGSLLWAQGRFEDGERYLRDAIEGLRRTLGNGHRETLTASANLGSSLYAQGRFTEAEPYLREALQGLRLVLGDIHPTTMRLIANMGSLLQVQGKLAEAEPYFHEALQAQRQVLGNAHPDTLNVVSGLGVLFREQGRLREAESHLREALEGRRRVLRDDHPALLASLRDMGEVLLALGELDEAEQYLREALEGQRQTPGNDHLGTVNSLGLLLLAKRNFEEAEPLLREALEGMRNLLGNEHLSTMNATNNMGQLLQAQGKLDEAESYFREALAVARSLGRDDHSSILTLVNNLGLVLLAQGKLEEAEPFFREALEGMRRLLGNEHPYTLTTVNNMGGLLFELGKIDEVEPYWREALEGRRRELGNDHPDTLESLENMGGLLERRGELVEAAPYRREALAGRRRELGDSDQRTVRSFTSTVELAVQLHDTGEYDLAESLLRESLEFAESAFGEDARTASVIAVLGQTLVSKGDHQEAETLLRQGLSIRQEVLPDDDWLIYDAMSLLGASLAGQEEYIGAEPLLLQGYEEMNPPDDMAPRKRRALERLVNLYEAWNKPELAATWRKLLDS